jgi:hypothetical protein
MKRPMATPSQMARNKLTNRKPILCAICERFIGPFAGQLSRASRITSRLSLSPG